MDYVIEKAEDSHLPEILHFLHENFNTEETMLKSLLERNPPTKSELELLQHDHDRLLTDMFAYSPCLVALQKTSKKIIGVNFMTLSKRLESNAEGDSVSAAFSKNSPKTAIGQEYFKYLSEIGEKADLYGKFPDSKAALEFYAVAVDKNHRRKGLATALMAEGITYAKTLEDVGFVFGVYTSVYSKRVAEKLGLKSYMDIDLLTYKNDKGEPIFQDTEPHNIVSVMALKL